MGGLVVFVAGIDASPWVVSGGGDVIVGLSEVEAGRWRWRSLVDRPSGRGGAQSEYGEPCEVDGGGEKVEIGVDFGSAADAGSASAVSSPHHVAELAFDLWAGGPVIGLPVGVGLTGAGPGERSRVGRDADGASTGGVGALAAQRAVRTVLREVGESAAVDAAADGDGDVVGAGDGVVVEVDGEAILGEHATRRRRRLGSTPRRDVFVLEALLELAGPVGRVPVHLRCGAVGVIVEEVVDEVISGRGVIGVAGGDDGVGDDLAVGSTAA
jgi:hypothetical protein